MLLHFSRTAFFFLAAFLLTYSQITRPRSTLGFWRRRYVQIGVPFLVWTAHLLGLHDGHRRNRGTRRGRSSGTTSCTATTSSTSWSSCCCCTLVFPAVLRVIRASSHHGAIMVGSLLFALLLAADLHYTSSFGVVGQWTLDIASKWPWARNPITYQEQFVAGILVALHFDQVRSFVERWYRQVIAGAVLMGVDRHLWYLIAVWTGSTHGPRLGSLPADGLPLVHRGGGGARVRRVDVVAAQACAARRSAPRFLSAEYLAGLTGGIFLCHVLFINLVRTWLGDAGITPHLGWAGHGRGHLRAHHRQCGALHRSHAAHASALGATGPVRAEQRARLGAGGAGDGSVRSTPTTTCRRTRRASQCASDVASRVDAPSSSSRKLSVNSGRRCIILSFLINPS